MKLRTKELNQRKQKFEAKEAQANLNQQNM